jgi:hypothetical protein
MKAKGKDRTRASANCYFKFSKNKTLTNTAEHFEDLFPHETAYAHIKINRVGQTTPHKFHHVYITAGKQMLQEWGPNVVVEWLTFAVNTTGQKTFSHSSP